MNKKKVTIGILGIQGSMEEHEKMLQKINCDFLRIKNADDLGKISGLIMPGGESTAIGKLLNWKDLYAKLQTLINAGLPVWGTCAGAILLAKKGSEFSLNVLDIEIERNAYGRQLDSFITKIQMPAIKIADFEAVFIRAPRITKIGKDTKVLAKIKDEPIFMQSGNMLASTFHPELTDDIRIHEYFKGICEKY